MIKDALDVEIEDKRRECEQLRAQLDHLEFELRTLQHAADLRPSVVDVSNRRVREPNSTTDSHKGGRQPGAISQKWRGILAGVATHYPGGATPADIASFGPALGLVNLRAADARQQAEKYVMQGYFERLGERYKVTPTACERFHIPAAPAAPETMPWPEHHDEEIADAA
jgi:hypothetical protein